MYMYLVSHGGRKQHRLSALRAVLNDFMHLVLKVLIQHSEVKYSNYSRTLHREDLLILRTLSLVPGVSLIYKGSTIN